MSDDKLHDDMEKIYDRLREVEQVTGEQGVTLRHIDETLKGHCEKEEYDRRQQVEHNATMARSMEELQHLLSDLPKLTHDEVVAVRAQIQKSKSSAEFWERAKQKGIEAAATSIGRRLPVLLVFLAVLAYVGWEQALEMMTKIMKLF